MKKLEINSPKYGIREVLVSDKDYSLLSSFSWRLSVRREGRDVRVIKHKSGNNQFVIMSRMIMNVTDPAILVDHKDRNPLNNQRRNLRVCTPGQSACNISSAKNASSKYLGVSFSERRQKYKTKEGVEKIAISPAWRAVIHKNRKKVHLGWFGNEKDAALAYNLAAKKLHGRFANLNNV